MGYGRRAPSFVPLPGRTIRPCIYIVGAQSEELHSIRTPRIYVEGVRRRWHNYMLGYGTHARSLVGFLTHGVQASRGPRLHSLNAPWVHPIGELNGSQDHATPRMLWGRGDSLGGPAKASHVVYGRPSATCWLVLACVCVIGCVHHGGALEFRRSIASHDTRRNAGIIP